MKLFIFTSLIGLLISNAHASDEISIYTWDCREIGYDAISQVVEEDIHLHGTMGIPETGGSAGVKFTALRKAFVVDFIFSKETGNVASVTATEPKIVDGDVQPDLTKPIASLNIPLRLDGKDSFEMKIFPADLAPYGQKIKCTLSPE